jgi:hypothetical protein
MAGGRGTEVDDQEKRMLKGRISKLAVAAMAIASAAVLTGSCAAIAATQSPTTATVSTSQASGHQLAARTAERGTGVSVKIAVDGAYDNCPSGDYCDFTSTGGEPLPACLYDNAEVSNWEACRNADESFANRTSGVVRLYYSPGLKGAWVCLNSGAYQNNLAGFTFNNGGTAKAGFGKPIENDVASSSTASGSCSNPLPWP